MNVDVQVLLWRKARDEWMKEMHEKPITKLLR